MRTIPRRQRSPRPHTKPASWFSACASPTWARRSSPPRSCGGSPRVELRPALVVTPPDRRQGRGRRLAPPPVARQAAELGLELHQTPSVNEPESLRAISDAEIDLGMVCAFGQLVKPPLLDEIEMLNVHPSLLPRWRGAAPIERAIMAGDRETGVAIMRLEEGLDSGPVALSERLEIGADEDFGSLSARLADLGGDLAVHALGLRQSGELEFAEQDSEGVTYAEKIEASERRLDPARTAVELANTTGLCTRTSAPTSPWREAIASA